MLSSHYFSGPMSWINHGTIDIQVDCTLPHVTDADSVFYRTLHTPRQQQSELAELRRQEDEHAHLLFPGSETWWLGANRQPATTAVEEKPIEIDVFLNLRHLNASVPLTDPDTSYTNTALVQPLVAYINTNYVSIPIHCDVRMPLGNFYGSTYPAEAGLYDILSEAVYHELVHKVRQQKQVSKLSDALVLGVNGLARAVVHLWKLYFVYSYNY